MDGKDDEARFQSLEYQIDYSQDSSLDNWVQKFDMYCSPRQDFGYFGTIYFLGSIFGSVIVPRCSDIFGRKPFTLICVFLHVIACTVVLLVNNLTIAYAMMFFQGFSMIGRALIAIVWIYESTRVEYSTKITSALFIADAFGNIYASIYFKYVSKNWAYFYAVPTAMMLISGILLLLFFDDSPKFYNGTHKYDKAKKCLTAIGRRNGVLGPKQIFKGTLSDE
jgi:MFS family permease